MLPWLQLGAGAAIIGALLWWRHDSVQDALREQAAAVEAAHAQRRAEVSEYVTAMAARTTAQQAAARAQQQQAQAHTTTLIRQVPVYVTPLADRGCIIPRGFVSLHDAAATGSMPPVPSAAGELVDRPAGVSLGAAGSAIVTNYGTCRALAAEVSQWRAWYVTERAAHEAVARPTPAQPGQPH